MPSKPTLTTTPIPISRRAALRGVSAGLTILSGAMLSGIGLMSGCSSEDKNPTGGAGGSSGSSGGVSGLSGSGGEGNVMSGGSGGGAGASAWATGGTARMVDADSYGDPFAAGGGDCALTCLLTQGPCWAPSAPVRTDVSEGQPGLPLRLALRLVEADGCTPVSDAEIEIWHASVDGVYSGHDVESAAFCTGNDADALSKYYFRGRGITDAEGKVHFHTCFPGWYASRAVHIHFAVRRSEHAGETTTGNSAVISQLFFPEALTAEIFGSVEGYLEQGQPDTTFATDTVIGSVEERDAYVLEYKQTSDGAMLAWKTIAISDAESCGSTDGGPGGGPPGGGPPPGM